jgi:hypothetical protein
MATDSGGAMVAARIHGPGIRNSESLRPAMISRNVKRGRLEGSAALWLLGACALRACPDHAGRRAMSPRHAGCQGMMVTSLCREAPMPDDPKPAPRRPMPPLMDRLGELCAAGRDSATYLWQVPNDEGVRGKIAGILAEIKVEAAKSGRQEMGRLAVELETAIMASPSPQQVELLQDGFERMNRLWAAAKSGLF